MSSNQQQKKKPVCFWCRLEASLLLACQTLPVAAWPPLTPGFYELIYRLLEQSSAGQEASTEFWGGIGIHSPINESPLNSRIEFSHLKRSPPQWSFQHR